MGTNWPYLAVGAVSVFGIVLGWLWRHLLAHSTRLTRAETNIANIKEIQDKHEGLVRDSLRSINEALVRIDTKLDRKADKP